MSVTIDISGARAKFKGLKQINPDVVKLIQDGAVWLQGRITDEIINGQFVGVISGNFRRSHLIEKVGKFAYAIVQDNTVLRSIAGVAPYGPYLRAWSVKKYGRDFYQIALDLFGPQFNHIVSEWFTRVAKAIRAKQPFKYTNPFPA